MSEYKTYKFVDDLDDDITMLLSPDGHLTITIDCRIPFTTEGVLNFAERCGYKLKKSPLHLVK